MNKTRGYTRELTKNETKDLQTKYAPHLKRTRGGFLEIPRKKKLLQLTKWEEYTSNEDIYNYFYDVRQHAESALGDFLLLCDTLSGDQIREIFELKVPNEFYFKMEKGAKRNELQRIIDSTPLLETLLKAILMSEDPINTSNKKSSKVETALDSWKFELSYRLVRICFTFLDKNKFITSKAHRRLIEETVDMLNSERHNTYLPKSDRTTFRIRKDDLVDKYLGIQD